LRLKPFDLILGHMTNNQVLMRVLVATGLGLGGCQLANAKAHSEGPEAYQGIVEHEERLLAFEVGGRVTKLDIQRGDAVTAGAAIAALDDTLERANRAGRLAEIHLAQAQLNLLQHGARPGEKRRAHAEVEAANATEALLRQNLERAKRLAASGATASAAVDDLQGQLAAATAKRMALEEQARLISDGSRSEDIEAAQARLEAAEADRKSVV
jgi:multidrug resistance efflux pump